jgi:hypothetical protein
VSDRPTETERDRKRDLQRKKIETDRVKKTDGDRERETEDVIWIQRMA